MTTAYRWFTLRRDGALTGYGEETNRPAWRSGVNTAFCGVDPDHEPPAPWCGCGFTCSTSLAVVAAHAALTNEAWDTLMRLHNEVSKHKATRMTGTETFVLAQVKTEGRSASASAEDEQELFHRVEQATIERVYLSATQRRSSLDVGRRYDAEVVVGEHSGRAWLDSFADGIAPTPEQLGCGSCPRPNPGADEYPVCVMCANRARKGLMFGHPDGHWYTWTPLGYK